MFDVSNIERVISTVISLRELSTGWRSPEANTSLQNMLTGGMETGGFRDTDIAAMEQANTAMAKTNLADMLGQTRAGSARSGTFFSTA